METIAKCALRTQLKSRLETTQEPLLLEQTQLGSDTTQFAQALEEPLSEQERKLWWALPLLLV